MCACGGGVVVIRAGVRSVSAWALDARNTF